MPCDLYKAPPFESEVKATFVTAQVGGKEFIKEISVVGYPVLEAAVDIDGIVYNIDTMLSRVPTNSSVKLVGDVRNPSGLLKEIDLEECADRLSTSRRCGWQINIPYKIDFYSMDQNYLRTDGKNAMECMVDGQNKIDNTCKGLTWSKIADTKGSLPYKKIKCKKYELTTSQYQVVPSTIEENCIVTKDNIVLPEAYAHFKSVLLSSQAVVGQMVLGSASSTTNQPIVFLGKKCSDFLDATLPDQSNKNKVCGAYRVGDKLSFYTNDLSSSRLVFENAFVSVLDVPSNIFMNSIQIRPNPTTKGSSVEGVTAGALSAPEVQVRDQISAGWAEATTTMSCYPGFVLKGGVCVDAQGIAPDKYSPYSKNTFAAESGDVMNKRTFDAIIDQDIQDQIMSGGYVECGWKANYTTESATGTGKNPQPHNHQGDFYVDSSKCHGTKPIGRVEEW